MSEKAANDAEQRQANEPDWPSLFGEEEILEATPIDVGYENANEIWKVMTAHGEFVVKISRVAPDAENHPFWRGLRVLFGLDVHADADLQKKLASFINQYTPLKIPSVRVIKTNYCDIEQPFTIAECVPGETAKIDAGENRNVLARQLGEHLGGLHRGTFDYWGTFSESTKNELAEWPEKLAESFVLLVESDLGAGGAAAKKRLTEFQEKARKLNAPKAGVLVFPDLRASQFLQHEGELNSLVDIESHVVAPAEFDLVAMEYALEAGEQTKEFIAGYEKFLPLPDISQVREVYRYTYFLISILAETDFDKWMNNEHKF